MICCGLLTSDSCGLTLNGCESEEAKSKEPFRFCEGHVEESGSGGVGDVVVASEEPGIWIFRISFFEPKSAAQTKGKAALLRSGICTTELDKLHALEAAAHAGGLRGGGAGGTDTQGSGGELEGITLFTSDDSGMSGREVGRAGLLLL